MTEYGRDYETPGDGYDGGQEWVETDELGIDTSYGLDQDTATDVPPITSSRYDGAYDVGEPSYDIDPVRASSLPHGAGDINDNQDPGNADLSDTNADDVVAAAEAIAAQEVPDEAEMPPANDTGTSGGEAYDTTQTSDTGHSDVNDDQDPYTDTAHDDEGATRIGAEPTETAGVYRSRARESYEQAVNEGLEEPTEVFKIDWEKLADKLVRGIASVIESSRLTEEEKAEVRDTQSAAEQSALLRPPEQQNLLKDEGSGDTSAVATTDTVKETPETPKDADEAVSSADETVTSDPDTATLSDPQPSTETEATAPPETDISDSSTEDADGDSRPREFYEELIVAEPTDTLPPPTPTRTPETPYMPSPPGVTDVTPDSPPSFATSDPSGTPADEMTDTRPSTPPPYAEFTPGPIDPEAPVVEGEFVDRYGRPTSETSGSHPESDSGTARVTTAREQADAIAQRAETIGSRIATESGYERPAGVDATESTTDSSTSSPSNAGTASDPTSSAGPAAASTTTTAPAPSPSGPEGPAATQASATTDPNATPSGADPNTAQAPGPNGDPAGSTSGQAPGADPNTSASQTAPSPNGPDGDPAGSASPASTDPNAPPAAATPNTAPTNADPNAPSPSSDPNTASATTDPNATPSGADPNTAQAPGPNGDPAGSTSGQAPGADPNAASTGNAATASGTATASGSASSGTRQQRPSGGKDRAAGSRASGEQNAGRQAPRYQATQPSRTHDARARRRAARRDAAIRLTGDAARFGGRVVAGIAGEIAKGTKDSAKGLVKKVDVANVSEQRNVGIAKLLRRAGILRRNLTVRVVNRAGQSAQITVKARGMKPATAAARARNMATKRRHFITRGRIAAKFPRIG